MKFRRLALLSIALLFGPVLTGEAADRAGDLKVDFVQVLSGTSFLREESDAMNAAVIWSQEGLREFTGKYAIRTGNWNPEFDGKHVFLIAFSDRLPGAVCDGVSHVTKPDSAKYCVDLRSSGIMFKRINPPKGMKYSSWVIVSIPRPDSISSVLVREPVAGGLSRQFGRKGESGEQRESDSKTTKAIRMPRANIDPFADSPFHDLENIRSHQILIRTKFVEAGSGTDELSFDWIVEPFHADVENVSAGK